jgi:glucose-6-phosphate isomerase
VKNKKIIYKNYIQREHLDLGKNKFLNESFNKNFKKISSNLDITKDIFHSLSNEFNLNFKLNDFKKFKKFNTIAIIGIGGSILGSKAIYYFLKDKIKKKLLFFDNIDEKKINTFKKKKNLKKILFIIISKSGNTIETLSNFLTLKIIKKNSDNLIIISEKKNNLLYLLANRMNLHHVEHRSYIGGRFSVLSEIGMLPSYLMGLNIKKIRHNLLGIFKFKNKIFLKNSSVKLSNLLIKKKFKNLIFFNYEPQLNNFLFWVQQLIAESLGKKGKGFLPTISEAPKDHHSLLQLYLDGPKDKIFYIFSSEKKNKIKVTTKNLDKRLNFLNKKNLNQIKIAQKNAFIKALKKNKIPFREFKIKEFTEETLGELFSYFIMETVLIGKLAQINPFDQPAVEQVKINTEKLLS